MTVISISLAGEEDSKVVRFTVNGLTSKELDEGQNQRLKNFLTGTLGAELVPWAMKLTYQAPLSNFENIASIKNLFKNIEYQECDSLKGEGYYFLKKQLPLDLQQQYDGFLKRIWKLEHPDSGDEQGKQLREVELKQFVFGDEKKEQLVVILEELCILGKFCSEATDYMRDMIRKSDNPCPCVRSFASSFYSSLLDKQGDSAQKLISQAFEDYKRLPGITGRFC